MSNSIYFAPCPRGLEAVLATELASCGAAAIEARQGGVRFEGPLEVCYRVNLESRIASRVLLRIAEQPYRDEHDIYAIVRSIAWREYFDVDRTIRVDTSAIRAPLKSLDFATLRIKDAVCDRFRDDSGRRPSVDTKAPDARIFAFLEERRFTLYLDTSGEPLFKRGYRRETGEAPIRENLAAGIIALAGWAPATPFLDPMCGSGTFLVEAAQRALGIAPGNARSFAFERLRRFEPSLWTRLKADARAREAPRTRRAIHGSDGSGRLVETARATLATAGLTEVVQLKQANALDLRAPAPEGVLVTNPPYGVRLGDADALADLLPRFGDVLKHHFTGWRCYFIAADPKFPARLRLRESKRTPLFNGAIECRLFEFRMVSGSLRARPT